MTPIKTLIPLVVAVVFMAGCQAEMMEKHGDAIQLIKTGQEEPGKGGVVRYLNTGMDAWKKARRADAEKQMRTFCGGSYAILAEGPRSQFGADMPIGKSVSLEVDQYTYIKFQCK